MANIVQQVIMIGIGATALVDAWALARRALLGTALPNYALVGRWLGHMPQGRFRHASIAAAPAIPGEGALGWAFHYLTGIAYAGLLVALAGAGWLERPTLLPALGVGLGTVVAPFFLMQPGMGAGIAASRSPNPAAARLQSLVTHGVFGLGLYLAALATRFLVIIPGA
jgi:hypothetical protein